MTSTILEMRDITKTFPGVKALSNVNLSVEEGEIHAVVGENGAGKSTLMKVLSGGKPDGLDEKTYNNDVKVVPSILLTPHDVDKSNYQALVVDSGYIKAEDLK